MPYPLKIQPIDDSQAYEESIGNDSAKPVSRSRLKRLFDRPFLRVSVAEKPNNVGEGKEGGTEFEPSSLCLAKMVQNFIEETNEKQSAAKCGRNRCNCFNGGSNDSSDDELNFTINAFGESIPTASFGDFSDSLKSLISCSSVTERNLLTDTSKIVEKNNNCKRKDELRIIVTDSLIVLGYDASICKSQWEKSPSYPAGEYEYIDVIVEGGERLLVDIDFRSEFEIARSTGKYKTILQQLPYIFVGKSDRLNQIVSVVSEAAKQSLKKKGLHIPPWRKAEYMKGKWLSPHTRTTSSQTTETIEDPNPLSKTEDNSGEFELIFGERTISTETDSGKSSSFTTQELTSPAISSPWFPPAIKPKSGERRTKMVTGLASLFTEKP
jgi:uncharacterized protein (TIGR01615 family)